MCFRWQKAPHTHRRAMLTFFTVVIWSQALSQPISSQQHENVCWTSPCTFLSCWVCRGACSSSRRLLCAGHSVQNGWGERMEGLFFCFFEIVTLPWAQLLETCCSHIQWLCVLYPFINMVLTDVAAELHHLYWQPGLSWVQLILRLLASLLRKPIFLFCFFRPHIS